MSESKQTELTSGEERIATRHYEGGEPRPAPAKRGRAEGGKRARRLSRAVELGLKRWAKAQGYPAPAGARPGGKTRHFGKGTDVEPSDCLKALPRRRNFIEWDVDVGPPLMQKQVFKLSYLKAARRIHTMLWAILVWYGAKYLDRLLGRDSDERRARRLRRIIEKMGGTAVKLGQQMSMRIDLMPYIYGVELSMMLDQMEPFPTEQAIKLVERQLKRPLGEVFESFDPEPVGSASVACVYQAILKTGEKVAVKVRRPGIGELFVADCQALAWVFWLLESLTLIHPGLAHNFLFEFRTMLIEELDFVKEARHTDLFRRRVERDLSHVTAPRVYFDLSGSDVLVIEFVSGVWVKELIAAVEGNNTEALEVLGALDIDPKVVAKRLVRTNQYGIFENLLFHADPHPSNVLVRPGNELVFIDFGSTGAYTTSERHNWRQLAYYQSQEDVGRMAQAALAIIEPLPPIDIDEFTKRLETIFWEDLYAFKSKHYLWYERTSARIWISFLELAREYNVSMNLNTLRMIRSTLLYETVAARIYPKINAWREHRKYNRSAGRRARRRVRRDVHKRLFEGLSSRDYLRVEQVLDMGNRFMYLLQRHLDAPPYRFSLLISKSIYAVNVTLRMLLTAVFITLSAAFVMYWVRFIFWPDAYRDSSLWGTYMELLTSRPFQVIALGAVWLYIRRILFRFWDKEIRRDNSSGLS